MVVVVSVYIEDAAEEERVLGRVSEWKVFRVSRSHTSWLIREDPCVTRQYKWNSLSWWLLSRSRVEPIKEVTKSE